MGERPNRDTTRSGTASQANNADRTRATQTIQYSILYEREIRAHGILNRRVHILPILAPHRLDNLAPSSSTRRMLSTRSPTGRYIIQNGGNPLFTPRAWQIPATGLPSWASMV